jgi:hypothetical protein
MPGKICTVFIVCSQYQGLSRGFLSPFGHVTFHHLHFKPILLSL